MHARLWAAGPKMAAKLEGKYLPLADLPRFEAQAGPFPTVNEGEFFLARQESDWVIQRWVLREQGVAVMGPPLAPLIEPVSPEMLRGAVLGYLREWWMPMLAQPGAAGEERLPGLRDFVDVPGAVYAAQWRDCLQAGFGALGAD